MKHKKRKKKWEKDYGKGVKEFEKRIGREHNFYDKLGKHYEVSPVKNKKPSNFRLVLFTVLMVVFAIISYMLNNSF